MYFVLSWCYADGNSYRQRLLEKKGTQNMISYVRKRIAHKEVQSRIMVRICAFLPAILMMGIIFYFSACDGNESSQSSGLVVRTLIAFLGALPFMQLTMQQKLEWAQFLEYPVRKAAHMTEYGILACAILFGVYVWRKTSKKSQNSAGAFPIAWVITVLYAATDELHQLFVPGRSGRIFDVGVDAAGALLLLLVVFGISKARRKKACKCRK